MIKIGYLHIANLYRELEILLFKECYALEKVHGTSGNISFNGIKTLTFFSSGEKHDRFRALFNEEAILKLFQELFTEKVIVYGEVYGGECQGMSDTYGSEMKFVVFEVKIGDCWLNVPNAFDVATKLGLEFVSYNKIPTDIKSINAERDLPSVQAVRNGCGTKMREGIVLHPLIEVSKNNGSRIIAKHKGDKFRETATTREVCPERRKVMEDARAIANEWVTPMRFTHILDKIDFKETVENTGKIVTIMVEDIYREGKGELRESIETRRAIGNKTARLFKAHIQKQLDHSTITRKVKK